VLLLGACVVFHNGIHLGRHLGFYSKLEIIKKRGKLNIFHAKQVEYDIIFFLLEKKEEKLMKSHLVTIEINPHLILRRKGGLNFRTLELVFNPINCSSQTMSYAIRPAPIFGLCRLKSDDF